MPLYTYKCKDCGEVFDLLIGVTTERGSEKCNKCGSKNVIQQMSTFNVGKSSSSNDSSCPTCPSSPTCPGYPSCPTGGVCKPE